MPEEEKFETNLLRAIVAELHYANLRQSSQDLYGRQLEKLEPQELQELQGVVLSDITYLYRFVTPALLSNQSSTEGPLSRTPPSRVQ